MSAPRKTLAPGALAGVSPHESPICLLHTPTALVTGASSSACCLLPSAPACHRLAVQQLHPLSLHVLVCASRRITSPNLTAVSAANGKRSVFLDSMER
ncbi:DNA-directed RNA polymerase subunit beta [Clarias magur]|uniref:DNA-directed RNA polymerase subunit beta n=1 Tax=Clarias magur TaxID=1594786 RepID=A0A8J4XH86_CLAMG|nr:DNA-directed RNA polymerase subunit beta [Clarias magur]